MKITKSIHKRTLIIEVEGEIDSTTSGEFQNSIKEDINKVDNLVLDFDKCSYISSAGLRVILSARKHINNQGEMSIINVNATVMDVLTMTGFNKILKIETK